MGPGTIGDERGMTVIEVVVTAVVGLIVAGAAMTFLIVSLNQQNAVASRTTASRQAEAGLEQMVRDLRQAMSEDSSGNALSATVSTSAATESTSLQFYIPTPGSDTTGQLVTWTCPSAAQGATYIGTCTRQVGSGTAQTFIDGVQSVTFTPTDSSGTSHALSTSTSASYSSPASVAIALNIQVVSQLDTSGSHTVRGASNTVALTTVADLRNFS